MTGPRAEQPAPRLREAAAARVGCLTTAGMAFVVALAVLGYRLGSTGVPGRSPDTPATPLLTIEAAILLVAALFGVAVLRLRARLAADPSLGDPATAASVTRTLTLAGVVLGLGVLTATLGLPYALAQGSPMTTFLGGFLAASTVMLIGALRRPGLSRR